MMKMPLNALSNLSPQNKRDAIALLKLMFPVIGLLLIGIYFHEFVVHAVEANLAINLGIIAAATYGVVLIIIRLVSAMMDFRVIERFGHEAAQGVYMKTLLDQPWLKQRYVRHYLSHIANTGGTLASQMDQSAIENELHALQGEYDSKLELPQFLVGFMIAMGLLGTFIGLLETLTGISGMLDGMGGTGDVQGQFMKLVVELRKPLAGMGIAFSASMFGLITSLMLAIMMTNLRRYISRVIALARNVMHELTEMTRTSGGGGESKHLSPDDIAKMAMEKPEVSGGGGGGSISSTVLAGRFELLAKKIEMLLGVLESGVAATQKTNDLLSFGPRMKEATEKSLEELKTIAARQIEQHQVMQSLLDMNAEVARGMGALLESQRADKVTGQETLKAIQGLSSIALEQHQTVRHALDVDNGIARSINEVLAVHKQAGMLQEQGAVDMRKLLDAQVDQRRLMQSLLDTGLNTQEAFAALTEVQKQGRTEFLAILHNLAEKLAKSEEISLGGTRHLFEVKENFIKLCKSFGVLDVIAASVSGQSLLLETLVEETRLSQRHLETMQQDIHAQVTPKA